MQWACGAEIINGSDNKLMPKNNAQRDESAAILTRFFQKVAQ
jgi:hypothetical protein